MARRRRYIFVIPKAVMVVPKMLPTEVGAQHGTRIAALEYVANRPLLHHALHGLTDSHIEDFVIAVDADALLEVRECVEEFVEDSEAQFESIDYAICADSEDMPRVLSAVAPLIGSAPCLIQPADGLMDEPARMFTDRLHDADLLLLSSTQQHAPIEGNRRFAFEDQRTQVATRRITDIAMFGPGALGRAVETVRDSHSLDFATLGSRLSAEGATVEFENVHGWHRYRGARLDLLELNRIALDRVVTDYPEEIEHSNHIAGRVQIHPSAVIRDSWIVGPAVIGRGATITDAYIGPYTSVGGGARIVGAEIERSIISPGASIMHVSGRLVSSLVGKDARVFRNFSMPRGLRLWVGDGDEIALC
jgi:glucose-1-phosphate thymidylyltransferase